MFTPLPRHFPLDPSAPLDHSTTSLPTLRYSFGIGVGGIETTDWIACAGAAAIDEFDTNDRQHSGKTLQLTHPNPPTTATPSAQIVGITHFRFFGFARGAIACSYAQR